MKLRMVTMTEDDRYDLSWPVSASILTEPYVCQRQWQQLLR